MTKTVEGASKTTSSRPVKKPEKPRMLVSALNRNSPPIPYGKPDESGANNIIVPPRGRIKIRMPSLIDEDKLPKNVRLI